MRAVRHSFSAGAAHDDRKSCPEPNKTVPDPVHGSSLDQATRPRGAPHRQPPSWLLSAHSPGRSRPLPRPQLHGCHSTSLSLITTEVPARAYIARARLGPVLRRCPAILPQHMQGGSRCPGRAVEPERARWHDPVLGRWLGLTPEQPALCLRGFPGRLRVALGRVSDPPGLGRRQGAQRAARGTIREKRYNLPHPGVHQTSRAHLRLAGKRGQTQLSPMAWCSLWQSWAWAGCRS